MRILHYAMGFPPYRSGGLTKLCVDLMAQQVRQGHTVAMLWPGQMGFFGKKTRIRDHGMTAALEQRVRSFEIVNPLPVPLDEGIADIAAFTRDGGKAAYDAFLDRFRPEVVHVHTLMGLHKSFLCAARERGVRLVFTTHDFFPICPKVTLFRQGAGCTQVQSCQQCGTCNATALSVNKIRVLQSPLYRALKDSALVKKLRKRHRDGYFADAEETPAEPVGSAQDYRRLRAFYGAMLAEMDEIHYNSSVTKAVYESVFSMPQGHIVSISHGDIADHREKRKFSGDLLRIRYLGPQSGAKGYFILKEALDQWWEKRQDFRLDVHFTPAEPAPYIVSHDRYGYGDLKGIFSETDVLVAPSVWHETFGFTVLEALSYGIPVVISGTVGAKDILAPGAGIVVENMTAEKLCAAFAGLTAQRLGEMNAVIREKQHIMTLAEMAERIERLCYGKTK